MARLKRPSFSAPKGIKAAKARLARSRQVNTNLSVSSRARVSSKSTDLRVAKKNDNLALRKRLGATRAVKIK